MSFRSPTPGVLIDNKYRIAERIGGGGMGDVFRAENVVAGMPVAIKFLHPEFALNEELSQRFFQEAQAVNRIRHPNVVDVLDAGVGDSGPYIVMEFLEGESVGTALHRVIRFDVDAAVATALPVLEALDAAHRAGIIHRDLKPENVFLVVNSARNNTFVRLLDFGIAKILDATEPSPRTRTGVVFGTPDYLSPEQATGDGMIDGRSDLFSVGVLLYELLTGARPFKAPTAVATAFKIVHSPAPTIAAAGVYVDARVEAIVARLLEKEPAKRFPSALEVIRELERIVLDPSRRAAALSRIASSSRRPLGSSTTVPEDDRTSIVSREGPPAWRRVAPGPAQVIVPSPPRSSAFAGGRAPEVPPQTALDPLISSRAPISPVPRQTPDAANAPRSLGQPFAKTIRNVAAHAIADSNPGSPPPRGSAPGAHVATRTFPPRFGGLYQVRGPVLRSVDRGMVELFGADVRRQIVEQMPEEYSADLRNDSINALVAYDLEALDAYMELATTIAVHDASRWRELGRLAVDGELYNVVRTLLRPSLDLASVLRRATTVWARLLSFGNWRVTPLSSGRVGLHIREIDPVASPLRQWMMGVVEQTTRRAVRADVRVVITQGEASFTPELMCEIG